MNYVLKKLSDIIGNASPQATIATILATHVAVLALLAVPELSCTIASSLIGLGELGWDQLSSPSPPTPAGDITLRVIRIWTNHVAEVELPRLRLAVARIDCEMEVTVIAEVWIHLPPASRQLYAVSQRRRRDMDACCPRKAESVPSVLREPRVRSALRRFSANLREVIRA
jgi:hypothetical protein